MNSRREFLKSTGRNLVLAFIGLSAAAGLMYRKINTQARAACPASLLCSGCQQLSNCKKDQAQDFISSQSRK